MRRQDAAEREPNWDEDSPGRRAAVELARLGTVIGLVALLLAGWSVLGPLLGSSPPDDASAATTAPAPTTTVAPLWNPPTTAAPAVEPASSPPTGASSFTGDDIDLVSQEAFDAFEACKDFVSRDLKAPSSATWRNPMGDQVRYIHDIARTWTIVASVDAQNSYGAELRTNYTCTVSGANDSWQLENLSVS